ncbi:MAG: metal-dependent hydrolase [Bacillota bacterium]
MDNITHGLIGLTVNSLLKQKDRTTFWVSLVASEIPDIDILYRFKGQTDYLLNHRGFSHSLPGLLLLAAAVTLIACRLWPGADRKRIFLLASLCLGLHVTFDLFTSWGTRLFFPFSKRWLYLDFVPIVDLVIIIIAVISLAVHRLAGGRRRLFPAAGALLICLFVLGRFACHEYLVAKYRSFYPGAGVSVLADFSPLRWKVIVEQQDCLLSGKIDLRELGQSPPGLSSTPVPPVNTDKYAAHPIFAAVHHFFRYPVYTFKEQSDGRVLVVRDFYYNFREVMFPLDGNDNIAGDPLPGRAAGK